MSRKRRICFVTGTRAEFGLMIRTLHAIARHPRLQLQIIATGMHLSRSHGNSITDITSAGFKVDAQVQWDTRDVSPGSTAMQTGQALSKLARAFSLLKSDVVLVVGDRVEAFAAASAAHISGKVVAHVHGGDRALGQVDDALRHAITKLSHLHFAATTQSANRLIRLGEDRWRIVKSGSPGIDGIRDDADGSVLEAMNLSEHRFAVLALHPTRSDDLAEFATAGRVLRATLAGGVESVVVVYPNSDPGSDGIRRRWESLANNRRIRLCRHLPRSQFLGLLQSCAFLIGNSSSGIIEAASFGTPVIDIGPRQQGRECGDNVLHATDSTTAIQKRISEVWRGGLPLRYPARNIYGSGAADRIAHTLASAQFDERLLRKWIAY